MPVTDKDIQVFTELALRIREETYGCGTKNNSWDRTGIYTIFKRQLVGMHFATAIELVVRHASDPKAETPAAIGRPFLPPAPETVKDDGVCPVHGSKPAPPFCGLCRNDELLKVIDPDPEIEPLPEGVDRLEFVRSQIAGRTNNGRRSRDA